MINLRNDFKVGELVELSYVSFYAGAEKGFCIVIETDHNLCYLIRSDQQVHVYDVSWIRHIDFEG